MNKKLIPMVVRLKQNNNDIIQGINQNDAGVVFDITVMDGLVPFNFSGYGVVTLKIKKPDETFTYDSNTGVYVDIVDSEHGRLKINIPTSCTAQNGMHYCRVGFSAGNSTLFETMTFNYFVGQNPNADSEDVIGTNEFPILNNLIAQVSDVISAEAMRASNEAEREEAENDRQENYSTLIALFTECLGFLEAKITDLQSMLDEFNEAVAQGASVDISTISALATKSWVNGNISTAFEPLDFGNPNLQNQLRLNRGTQSGLNSIALDDGEPFFVTDTGKLYMGHNGSKVLINGSPYVAGTTAPTDTTLLWIDTTNSTRPVLKYYNGSAWTAINTAVFA